MCYTIEQRLESALRRAQYWNDERNIKRIRKILKKFEDQYNASGYSHPKIIAYNNDKPYEPILFTWGLIPHWTKTENEAKKIWNNTINARSETIFEKPSFRDAAKYKRCIIPVNGFFEYHYFNENKYPFYIKHIKHEVINLAGIWAEWTNMETGEIIKSCSILTTKANKIMQKIHNNPKLQESRMPVILTENDAEKWLKPFKQDNFESLKVLLKAYPENELQAHTVGKLNGKDSKGNVPEATEEYFYEELEF